MDKKKQDLKGSPKRDIFKHLHKRLDPRFYATDADFCLVSKYPPGTVAYLDYKGSGDGVTFAEAIQYNKWVLEGTPVYIIEGRRPETGPFTVKRYLWANWRPDPPDVIYGKAIVAENWAALGNWERELRKEYRKHEGWGPKSDNVAAKE